MPVKLSDMDEAVTAPRLANDTEEETLVVAVKATPDTSAAL